MLRAVGGRVILLRPAPQCFDHNHDDIDLLLTEFQRQQLLNAVFAKCVQSEIHCRIQQCSPSKTQLILWNRDASQKLMIDLWTDFIQLPLRRNDCIPADRLLNALTESAYDTIPALHHLPPDIELCLLIQHLAKKRKPLASPRVQHRIALICNRLKAWEPESTSLQVTYLLLPNLREIAERLPQAMFLAPKSIAATHDYLVQRLSNVSGNRGLQILERRKRPAASTQIRKAVLVNRPSIAFIGSDGSGKSSVVAALAEQRPNVAPLVAKKLYRRSLIYQMASGLMKRLSGTARDNFDSYASVPITLRALAALWLRSLIPAKRQTTLLDRSVASFLIKDRKTDLPRLSRGSTWIESLVPPTTSVLLTLSHSELVHRKNEMSAPGHETYQRLLFEQALRQHPTDVILLSSLASAQAAANAVAEILRAAPGPTAAKNQTAKPGKAAA